MMAPYSSPSSPSGTKIGGNRNDLMIFINLWTGETLSMCINNQWKVEELKIAIDTLFGVPRAVQQIGHAFDKPEWTDVEVLAHKGVGDGTTLCLWWAPLRVFVGATLKNSRATSDPYNNNNNNIWSSQPHGIEQHPEDHLVTMKAPPTNHIGAANNSGVHLFIFDLDDTLTKNGIMPAPTRRCLETLAQHHRLAIASFNLSAVEFLKNCGCVDLFDVIVCGFYQGVSKIDHIRKVLSELQWPSLGAPHRGSVYFFDDQPGNVEDVRAAFPGTVCLHVRTLESLPLLVDSLLAMSKPRGGAGVASPSSASPLSSPQHIQQQQRQLLSPSHHHQQQQQLASPSSPHSPYSSPLPPSPSQHASGTQSAGLVPRAAPRQHHSLQPQALFGHPLNQKNGNGNGNGNGRDIRQPQQQQQMYYAPSPAAAAAGNGNGNGNAGFVPSPYRPTSPSQIQYQYQQQQQYMRRSTGGMAPPPPPQQQIPASPIFQQQQQQQQQRNFSPATPSSPPIPIASTPQYEVAAISSTGGGVGGYDSPYSPTSASILSSASTLTPSSALSTPVGALSLGNNNNNNGNGNGINTYVKPLPSSPSTPTPSPSKPVMSPSPSSPSPLHYLQQQQQQMRGVSKRGGGTGVGGNNYFSPSPSSSSSSYNNNNHNNNNLFMMTDPLIHHHHPPSHSPSSPAPPPGFARNSSTYPPPSSPVRNLSAAMAGLSMGQNPSSPPPPPPPRGFSPSSSSSQMRAFSNRMRA